MSYTVSSGVISTGIILENDFMTVLDGGTANSTTMKNGGYLYVSSGGTANGTTVSSAGHLTVSSGGTANSTTVVKDWGWLYVYSGGTANSTTMSGGSMYVSSGGTASSTTMSGGCLFISSGGAANGVTLNSWGRLYVSSGGTATNIAWTPCEGYIWAEDGAVVTYAGKYQGVYFGSNGVLQSSAMTMTGKNVGGDMCVMESGIADSTVLTHNGRMFVYDGGLAVSTTLSSGWMYVQSGGSANSITVNPGGNLYVSGGGTATDVNWTPCVGFVHVADGAIVTYTSTYSGVYYGSGNQLHSHAGSMSGLTLGFDTSMYVMSGGTANSTVVSDLNAVMYVESGGTANSTTVKSRGNLHLSNGGTAKNTVISAGGVLFVSSGGTADTTAIPGSGTMNAAFGAMIISNGGVANNTLVSRSGKLSVSSGGTATGTTVKGGYLDICSGGTASNTTVASGGKLYVSSGGTANSTTMSDVGSMYVAGTANSIMLNSGTLYVWGGGTANSITMNSNSYLHISSGGTANNTTVNSGRGYMAVYDGGTAKNTTVNSGGSLWVSSGGTATDVKWTPCVGFVHVADGAIVTYTSTYSGVYYGSGNQLLSHTASMSGINLSGGNYDAFAYTYTGMDMYVMSGGTAESIKVNSGGNLYVSGGAVTAATVGRLGHLYIQGGGTAKSTTMKGDGSLYVCSGGTATDTVMNAGFLEVSSGGTANNTILNSGALYVSGGGTVKNTTVRAGGELYVKNGGKVTGELTIVQGGSVFAYEGAVINFNLAKRTASSKALVNDLSLIDGSPTYTVSVAADQAAGQYRLAGGASALAGKTLSIRIGSGAAQSIKVDGAALTSAGVQYALALAKGDLTLRVGGSSPDPGKPDPEPGTPDAPANLAAQVKKYNIACSWSKVAAEKGVKVSYQVKVDGAIQTVKSTKFTLKNTTVGKHTFAVRTVLTAGDGKENHSTWSSVSADVGDVTVPKLGRLTASVDGYTGTITLDASDNGAVDHYVVTLGGITKNVAGTKESVSFDDLAIGKHTAAVQAFDAAGNASKVKKVKLTVKDATPPETVTGFNAVSAAKGKAILSWDAVNDNSGKPVAYEVELNGKIIKSRKTTCSVKLPDGDHSYRVRAVDKAKNVGAWSAVQEFSIATDAKSAAIALSYCDTLRLNSALQAADASFLTPSAVKEQAFLAAL